MTAEMQAAYASVPEGVVILHTVEINHETFEAPARLVANSDEDIVATLEADAPLNAGEAVTFNAVSFNFTEPGFDDDGPTPAKAIIDNASGHIGALMKLTRTASSPVTVIYRAFRSDGLTLPGQVIRGLELSEVEISHNRAEGSLSFPEISDQNFPRRIYDDLFPALQNLG